MCDKSHSEPAVTGQQRRVGNFIVLDLGDRGEWWGLPSEFVVRRFPVLSPQGKQRSDESQVAEPPPLPRGHHS
jgi:hypothetical protein